MKIDYRVYKLSVAEYITAAGGFLMLAGVISYLFYNSALPMLFMMPFFLVYIRMMRASKLKARQKRLSMEFKDMVQAISASLSTGASFERSISSAYEEMRRIYSTDSYVVMELRGIIQGISLNENVEELLKDFGERSGIQDIYDFSQVVAVAKRTGGDMVKIMKRTAENIGQKYAVENEIQTVISAKKYEQKIMTAMPLLIVVYLRIANQGYVDILYENMLGRLVMTVCLAMCVVSFLWSTKIIDIGV